MSDRDTITLHKSDCALLIGGYQCTCGFHQRQNKTPTALAAEQPKPEPVVWLSRDKARLALWKAINSREFGNPTDDKLILDHLRQQGLWIGKVTSPAPPEDEAMRRDAERYRYLRNRDPKEVFDKSGKAAGVWIDWEDDLSGLQLLTGDDADAAIDAAMKEGT